MQVKITEPLDEMSNALMAVLSVVGGMAHIEDEVGEYAQGARSLVFSRVVGYVAAGLDGKANTNLAVALLNRIIEDPDPKKARPALEIVK